PVERSLAVARRNGDRAEIAYCLWTLGTLAFSVFDSEGARTPLEESLALCHELGDDYYMARAADYLGAAYSYTDRVKSVEFSRQSLDLRREIGDKCGMTLSLTNLAGLATSEGRYSEAERYGLEIEAILREMGGAAWASRCAASLAFDAFCQGNIER